MISRLPCDGEEPPSGLDCGMVLHCHEKQNKGESDEIIEWKEYEEEFRPIQHEHRKFDADAPGSSAPPAVRELQIIEHQPCRFEFALEFVGRIAVPGVFVNEAFRLIFLRSPVGA